MNLSVNEMLTLDVAMYYNQYKDLISFVQVSAPGQPLTFQVVNLKTAIMQGADIGFRYRPCSWFGLRGGYAFLDARDTSPGRFNNALAYKARHTFTLSIDAEYRNWAFTGSLRSRSRLEEVFIYPDSTPGGYISGDTKFNYQFNGKTSLYLAITNIGNVQYEELERYRMPGRAYTVGARLKI